MVFGLLPKLGCDFINCSVLCFGNGNKNIDYEKDLNDHEDEEDIGSTKHLDGFKSKSYEEVC